MSATSKPSRAELVAELRKTAAQRRYDAKVMRVHGKDQMHEMLADHQNAQADLLDRAISALTAPLSADRELRPEVLAFAHLMEAKLRENDHKGGWANEHQRHLFDRLQEEADELALVISHGTPWSRAQNLRAPNPEWVGSEAADVANFAMMIADVCGALTAPRGAGEDHVGDADDMVSGPSYATRPQPSSKSELQGPCDLEGWRLTNCCERKTPLHGPFCPACNPEMVEGWQPIESAPKDGTPILAASLDGHRYITAWTDDVYTAQCGSGGPEGWFSGKYRDRWGDSPEMDRPTHWRPLPAPPSDDPKPVLPANAKGMK